MRLNLIVLTGWLALASAQSGAHDASQLPLPQAKPETVGISSARLARLTTHFAHEAEIQSAAGYVMMVAREGKLVYANAVGQQDIEHHIPMSLTTRFRIASMTKPITTVAVLMLYEQGKFHLDDPISRFLPEFAHPKVFIGLDANNNFLTDSAHREITIRDLLTHSSGLGYVFDPKTPLGRAYGTLGITPATELAEVVQKIATLPLYFHPGEDWRYSFSDDVLGRLVEVIAGVPFDQFLATEIFKPLGMNSTGFYVAPSEKAQVATVYKHTPEGTLTPSDLSRLVGDVTDAHRWPSGGGGLISTAGDYLRFAQMLANSGTFEGHEYLSPATVALMTQNQVPDDAMYKYWGADSVGLGYGLGVGVQLDGRHSLHASYAGDFSWGGVWGTHWVASPKTGLVAVCLTQIDRSGNTTPQRTETDFLNLTYASLIREQVAH